MSHKQTSFVGFFFLWDSWLVYFTACHSLLGFFNAIIGHKIINDIIFVIGYNLK